MIFATLICTCSRRVQSELVARPRAATITAAPAGGSAGTRSPALRYADCPKILDHLNTHTKGAFVIIVHGYLPVRNRSLRAGQPQVP